MYIETCNQGLGDSHLAYQPKCLKTSTLCRLYVGGEDLGDTGSNEKRKCNEANAQVNKGAVFAYCLHENPNEVAMQPYLLQEAALEILTSLWSTRGGSPHPYLPTFPIYQY